MALSYALFVTRGIWMINGSAMLARRWVKVAPHIIDTIMLVSAIALTMAIHQYPFVNGWLTAKVVALLAYIVLGAIALKRGKTRGVRIGAWLAAQAVFFYIVAVAVTRQPLPV